jgi:hypothetical protein
MSFGGIGASFVVGRADGRHGTLNPPFLQLQGLHPRVPWSVRDAYLPKLQFSLRFELTNELPNELTNELPNELTNLSDERVTDCMVE